MHFGNNVIGYGPIWLGLTYYVVFEVLFLFLGCEHLLINFERFQLFFYFVCKKAFLSYLNHSPAQPSTY